MSRETARWALVSGALTGLMLSVAMVLAFGIFDVQCRDGSERTEWDAAAQVCVQPNVEEGDGK